MMGQVLKYSFSIIWCHLRDLKVSLNLVDADSFIKNITTLYQQQVQLFEGIVSGEGSSVKAGFQFGCELNYIV